MFKNSFFTSMYKALHKLNLGTCDVIQNIQQLCLIGQLLVQYPFHNEQILGERTEYEQLFNKTR